MFFQLRKDNRSVEYQLQRENPIAVFDSGVGGISVLRELIRIMPEEDFIYFGDSKNAPYGTKEKEKLIIKIPTIRYFFLKSKQPTL